MKADYMWKIEISSIAASSCDEANFGKNKKINK